MEPLSADVDSIVHLTITGNSVYYEREAITPLPHPQRANHHYKRWRVTTLRLIPWPSAAKFSAIIAGPSRV